MNVLKYGSRGDDVKRLQRILHLYEDGIFGNMTKESVQSFQREHGLFPDGIVGDKTWSALLKEEDSLVKSKRVIKEIIVHCTATPEGRISTVEQIRYWHKQNGWKDIGYHYVVYLDGSVHDGRNVNISGAHCEGHNSHSIGVCYVGGCKLDGKTPKDTRTDAQKKSLLSLLKKLKSMYPQAKIYGHRDFSRKDCPSFDAKNEYKYI